MADFELLTGCRYGRFLVPPRDAYVGNALREYGEYSEHELELLLQLAPPNCRVVVVGANIGALVVPLARRAGEVVAFEPQRWVFQLLCANAVLNGLVNTRCYWAAVGDRRRVASVPVLDHEAENNFGGYELAAGEKHPGDKVPVLTLDQVPDLDRCALLTIDVEGMELEVLQGAAQLIRRWRPAIFFEADRPGKRDEVFRLLDSWDYQQLWYPTPLYNKDNFKKNPDPGILQIGAQPVVTVNVLALPRERDHKLTGFTPVEVPRA